MRADKEGDRDAEAAQASQRRPDLQGEFAASDASRFPLLFSAFFLIVLGGGWVVYERKTIGGGFCRSLASVACASG